jgi:hypothetical protein
VPSSARLYEMGLLAAARRGRVSVTIASSFSRPLPFVVAFDVEDATEPARVEAAGAEDATGSAGVETAAFLGGTTRLIRCRLLLYIAAANRKAVSRFAVLFVCGNSRLWSLRQLKSSLCCS